MKSKKIIIAIVAILVVLSGTFAGLWFFTDLLNFLKPENEVFSNQLEKALNVEDAKFVNYSDFLKEYDEMSKKPVTSKINMTAELKLSDLDSDVQDIINKSKITLESKSDMSSKKSQNKIGLYTNNSEVLSLDLVTNKDKIAIGSKDLYDKYLAFSIEDLVELAGKESDMDEDEIKQLTETLSGANIDPYKLLYISEDDLKHFDETYRDCLKTLINKDCYSSEKKVEVEVDGKDVKTTAYYLTLTGEDTFNFINDLLKLIKDDDVIAKIAAEKANMILEAAGEEKISEKEVKELLSELTDSLVSELESIKEEKDSAIQIAIYSSKNNPVRIEFNTIEDIEDMDEKDTLLSIEYAKNKTIYSIIADENNTIEIINEYEKNSEEEKIGSFEVKMAGTSFGTLDYEIINKEKESKIDLSLNIPLAQVSADVKFSSNGNYKKEEVTFTGSIAVKYQSQSVKINLDGSMKYGDANIPELTSSNSVDILNLSETEMKEVVTDIMEKAADVLPARLKLIGIDVDEEDILPSGLKQNITVPQTQTPNVTLDSNKTQQTVEDVMNSQEYKDAQQKAEDIMNSQEYKDAQQKAQDLLNSQEMKDLQKQNQELINSIR